MPSAGATPVGPTHDPAAPAAAVFGYVVLAARRGRRQHGGDLGEQAGLVALHRERVVTTALDRDVRGGGVAGVRGVPGHCRTGRINTDALRLTPVEESVCGRSRSSLRTAQRCGPTTSLGHTAARLRRSAVMSGHPVVVTAHVDAVSASVARDLVMQRCVEESGGPVGSQPLPRTCRVER